MPTKLPGNYELCIIVECNLHCAGCIVLDYHGTGVTRDKTMSLQDVKDLTSVLEQHDYVLEMVSVVGGEPTIHPEFDLITKHVIESDRYLETRIYTNGTRFEPHILKTLKLYDKVYLTDYVLASEGAKMSDYDLTKLLPNIQPVWRSYNFLAWGKPGGPVGIEVSGGNKKKNWKDCFMKDLCHSMNIDGVYRCRIMHNEDIGMVSWENKEELVEMLTRNEPFDRCGSCLIKEAPTYEWRSNKPDIDKKNYEKGVQIIASLF